MNNHYSFTMSHSIVSMHIKINGLIKWVHGDIFYCSAPFLQNNNNFDWILKNNIFYKPTKLYCIVKSCPHFNKQARDGDFFPAQRSKENKVSGKSANLAILTSETFLKFYLFIYFLSLLYLYEVYQWLTGWFWSSGESRRLRRQVKETLEVLWWLVAYNTPGSELSNQILHCPVPSWWGCCPSKCSFFLHFRKFHKFSADGFHYLTILWG